MSSTGAEKIQHVFVLMLENRAFDHMLGFSGIDGTDASTGKATVSNGLDGTEENVFSGISYTASQPADWAMAVDPGHEFPDVLCQLCGPASQYLPGGTYPAIDNSGFVASYDAACKAAQQQRPQGEVLKCYSAAQLPVLNSLATEFALCDNWHASMPGPTWPNRLFAHAASSGGLDHSPTDTEIVAWETVDGFSLKNGSIFDLLKAHGISRRLYAGDDFPMTASLKGITLEDIRPYKYFQQDLGQASYPYSYIFIEPSYRVENDYRCSTSQHPLDDVTRGESLIKCTYEALRNSPRWTNSLLIVTWDEHGGFFDHAIPPSAPAPGDTKIGATNSASGRNRYGFTFEQLGPRVPAVVVSPWIPRNTIDHRVYDHAAIPATVEALFSLPSMTARDKAANTVLGLLSRSDPRDDAPASLPSAADSGIQGCAPVTCGQSTAQTETAPASAPPAVSRADESINDGNLPVVVHAAMRQDLELSPPGMRPEILREVASLKTRGEAARYMESVRSKVAAAQREA